MNIGEAKNALLQDRKVQSKALGLTMAETPTMLGFVVIKTPRNSWIPWNCSQEDFLANDWEVVE